MIIIIFVWKCFFSPTLGCQNHVFWCVFFYIFVTAKKTWARIFVYKKTYKVSSGKCHHSDDNAETYSIFSSSSGKRYNMWGLNLSTSSHLVLFCISDKWNVDEKHIILVHLLFEEYICDCLPWGPFHCRAPQLWISAILTQADSVHAEIKARYDYLLRCMISLKKWITFIFNSRGVQEGDCWVQLGHRDCFNVKAECPNLTSSLLPQPLMRDRHVWGSRGFMSLDQLQLVSIMSYLRNLEGIMYVWT